MTTDEQLRLLLEEEKDESLKSPEYAVSHAIMLQKDLPEGTHTRFPEGEELIASKSETAVMYVEEVLKKRWEQGEEAIYKDVKHTLRYIHAVPREEFDPAQIEIQENVISERASQSVQYAIYVLKGRFKKGEEAIRNGKSPYNVENYLRFLVKLGILVPRKRYVVADFDRLPD